MPARFVKPKKACEVLGICSRTLTKWADEGVINFIRPGASGHRLYDVESVGDIAASDLPEPEHTVSQDAVKAIYARVSTRKQLPYLETQIATLKAKYPDHVVFSDCASGLNFKRKGLLSLLQLAFDRCLQVVHIAYKDRLCRFAYELLEHIFKKHGVQIIVETDGHDAPERELADDVLSIITVFGARIHGKRSGLGRRQQQQAAETARLGDAAAPSGSRATTAQAEAV
jgi:putative resolvase